MRVTIERLRTWIVLLGIVLVVAIAGFLAYARYRLRQVGRDLPAKLGLEIQQSTNDFTISKSHAGHTLFVLHASKAVQYKGGGHAVLHDVSITMYGKDGAPAGHISGSQFDYDPATKVARADGAVDIELADPTALKPGTKDTHGAAAAQVPAHPPVHAPIQVKTSGLVFNQETQVASTERTLMFQQGEASGSARGATYDSAKGTLVLTHDVVLHARIGEDPIAVTAEGATYDRNARQLYLIQEKADYIDRRGSSDQAIVFFRPDGAADHITTEGHMHLTGDDGSEVQASSSRAQLDAKGALQQVKMDGGLLFITRGPGRTMHVNSNSGTFTFAPGTSGGKAIPKHAQLSGAASVVEQLAALPGDPHGSETREFRAGKMDVDLSPDAAGRVHPDGVLASGSAVVTVHTIHEKTPQQITTLKGDEIFATLAGGSELSGLRATGDTSIEQSTPGGIDQISSADSLLVKFLPGKRGDGQPGTGQKGIAQTKTSAHVPGFGEQGSQIETAVQQGHALLVQTQPGPTPGTPPVKTDASADRIAYDGATGSIKLSGGTPGITQDAFNLTAAAIEFDRTSGNAAASGNVKVSYGSERKSAGNGATNDAMHVLADHARLDHAKDETTFYGTPHGAARLWQGGNSITAPVIVLSRTRQLLSATGPAESVKATFVENGKPRNSAAAAGANPAPLSVVRTSSSSLVYSGGERKATLAGGVVAQETTGTLRSSTLELYLHPEAPAGRNGPGAGPFGPGGQLDRLIAQDRVQIVQGDRGGTGERLVYTADDGHFLLTGTVTSPPRVTDPRHGTVTGSSLLFNDRDDSVVVSHGPSPTVTDTHTNHDAHTPHPAKPGR